MYARQIFLLKQILERPFGSLISEEAGHVFFRRGVGESWTLDYFRDYSSKAYIIASAPGFRLKAESLL